MRVKLLQMTYKKYCIPLFFKELLALFSEMLT